MKSAGERGFGSLGRVLPDHLVLLDLDGTIRSVNEAAREALKRDPVGVPVSEVFDFGELAAEEACRLWAGSDAALFFPVRAAGTEYRAEGARVGAGTPDDGVLVRLVPAAEATRRFDALNQQIARLEEEVERRIVAERTVAQSARRIEQILRTSPDPALTTDADGRIVLASGSAVDFFREEVASLEGQDVGERIPAWPALLARLDDAVPGEDPFPVETAARRADGGIVPVELSLSRTTVAGEIWYTALFRDLTERRRREVELRRAQRMEAVGQLTGGVAHDFNNLLTVIMGSLELLDDGGEMDGERRELVADAYRAAERGARVTRQLLAFSRRQALAPQPMRLGDTVHDLVGLLRRTLGADIAITVADEPELWVCEVDPGQMESSLLNLAINARHAMPEGGSLTIRLENVTVTPGAEIDVAMDPVEPGDYVRLSVTDDGVGMPEEVRARVFEPFFTTKEPGQGTGLGLSMVYGFVKQSGGFARVESRPGEGTTVVLHLPRSRASVDGSEEGPAPDAADRGGLTALIVEDLPDVRVLLKRYLGRLGHGAQVAGTVPQALKALEERGEDFDLVISDIVLPGGKSGVDLAVDLAERRPDLPVLLISGYAAEMIANRDRIPDRVPLLGKPFTLRQLERAILGLQGLNRDAGKRSPGSSVSSVSPGS